MLILKQNSIPGIRPPKQRALKNKQAAEKENQNEMKPTKLNPVKEKLVNQEKEGKTQKVKSVCAWSQTLGVPMFSSTSQTVIRNSTDNCSQTDDITEVRENDKQIFVIGRFCAVQQSSGLWIINPPRVKESV